MTSEIDIYNDYMYCKEIINKHSKSFSIVFSQLPEEKKNAIFAVYAFCRKLDDSIDVYKDNKMLTKYEIFFKEMLLGKTINEPIFLALQDSFKKFDLSPRPFFELINGIRSDQNFEQPQSEKELLNYCYQVAGTVGEAILPILAKENHQELRNDAISLGCAMQLTNILRDVGQDLGDGRIYFSKDTMEYFGITVIDQQFVPKKNYQLMWEYYASKAEDLYIEGLSHIYLYDADSKMIVKSAAEVYKAILSAVRKIDYSLDKKATVSRMEKIKILSKNTK
ncbi:phytoene/squalene synthase family protein [Enterococcus sp. DIV0086]|uniref:phytoene/squalene synthase family protein n=1 Tax=Enterococcus sp. DIV0086 TaxID=2774655 RepID=UPI003D2B4FA3